MNERKRKKRIKKLYGYQVKITPEMLRDSIHAWVKSGCGVFSDNWIPKAFENYTDEYVLPTTVD